MTAGSEFAAATRRFAAQASTERRQIWPCTVRLSTGATLRFAKSPTRNERVLQEQGAGFVQLTTATFTIAAELAYQPEVGAKWTITAYDDFPAEVGTQWQCTGLTRASVGSDHVAKCFRLD